MEKSTDRFLHPPPPLPNQAEQPSWVLLDLLAYIADRNNSTSACTEMSDGTRIRVTLCAAPPPLVSYLCVWCPDQKPGETPHMKGCVVEAADSDLVFLYASPRSRRFGPSDCFVYKASNGGKGPSLHRLELPHPSMSTHRDIALLPYIDLQVEEIRGSRFRLFPGEDEIVSFRSHKEAVSFRQADEGRGGRFRLFPDEDEIVVSSPHEEAVSCRSSHAGDGIAASVEGGGVDLLHLSQFDEDEGEGEGEGEGEEEEEGSVSLHRHEGHRFLLRRHMDGDSDFCIALLKCQGSSGTEQHNYELCVFHSTDGQWKHTPFSISGYCKHLTYKAINLGQGLVGFVDLWRGIIVCDVLGRRPARYLPLPADLIVAADDDDMPLLYRDIAILEGRLTVVDLCDIGGLDTDLNRQAWEVSTWSRQVTHLWEEDWSQDCIVQSGDFSLKDATGVDLLPKVVGSMTPTLELPYMAHPTLSLSDSHVVYVMGKLGYLDKKVLLMSLDMKERRLQAVTMFHAERMVGVPFDYSYVHSRIPQYFKPDVVENLKRPGMFHATYPRKLHETGSSKGAEGTDNAMDVD